MLVDHSSTLKMHTFIDLKFEFKRAFVFMGYSFPMARIASKLDIPEEADVDV